MCFVQPTEVGLCLQLVLQLLPLEVLHGAGRAHLVQLLLHGLGALPGLRRVAQQPLLVGLQQRDLARLDAEVALHQGLLLQHPLQLRAEGPGLLALLPVVRLYLV